MAAFPIVNTPLLQNINGSTRQIHLETSASQVKTADGSDVESKLAAPWSTVGSALASLTQT